MANEKIRWYDSQTLQYVTEVEKANKKGMTKTTLVHARKFLLLPSVTSILKLSANFVLQNWMVEQAIRTCIEFPFDRDKNDEEMTLYMAMIHAKAGEYANHAADRGTQIHGDVEEWIMNRVEPADPVSQDVASNIESFFRERGITTDQVSCERPFGSTEIGWAGTPDFDGRSSERIVMVDLKTTDLAKFEKNGAKPYDSHGMQLGAYDIGTNTLEGRELWNCYADRDTGRCIFKQHADPEYWRNRFQALYEYWVLANKYDPRA